MVMCLLALLGMKAWFSAFGFTLLSQRILTWGMNLLTLFIPYFGLLKGSERSKYIYYLCGAFIIFGPGIAKCCTPDTFTSVLLAIAIVSFVKMLGNKRFLSLSVSTALLIAARFPNVVAVPLISYVHVIPWRQESNYAMEICSGICGVVDGVVLGCYDLVTWVDQQLFSVGRFL